MEVAASAASISGIVMIFLLLLLGVLFLFSIVTYIIYGVSMLTIAKNRGLSGGWMAFFPFVSWFQLGKVADDIREKTTDKKSSLRVWMLICSLVTVGIGALALLLYVIFIVVGMFGMRTEGTAMAAMPSMLVMIVMLLLELVAFIPYIALFILQYVCLYQIYADYAPDKKVLFLILSIVFSIIFPFFLFAIRNKPAQSLPMLDAQWQEVNP